MRRWLPIALAAAATHAAHADGVAEELSAGAAASAGSRWVSNRLAGMWDVAPAWQLRLDVSATRAAGAASGETYVGSLSAVFSPDEHWSLRFNSGWSPGVVSDVTVPVPTGGPPDTTLPPDARLHATASWVVLGVGVDYHSASDDMHSVSASLGVGETYFRTHQEVVGVDGPGPDGAVPFTAGAELRCGVAMCAGAPGMWLPQTAELGQFAVNANITDTIDRDTDLSLDASYYLYGDDPTRSGYFALATLTASTRASATSAPLLRAALAPSITHRWGALSTTLGLAYTRYASGREFDTSAALSIEYAIALAAPRRLTLDARLEASSHGNTRDAPTPAGSAALGMQYSW